MCSYFLTLRNSKIFSYFVLEGVSRAKSSRKKMKQDPTWQPLTLNALVQYSDKRKTVGAGQFRNGSMKMYPIANVDNTVS